MIKKIPPIKSQKGIERQYQKQLNKLGKALALGVREQVLNYLKAQQSSYVMDGFGDQLGVIFKKLNSIFTGAATASFAETTASQMVQKVGAASKNRFNRAVTRATGVDLGSVIATEGLEDFTAVSINKNVSLIKSLPEEYLKQVETIVNNGVVSGARYSTIEKEIISKTGANSKLANRIKTIARNEVQTINSQIILRRSESLGITKGIYKSSKDERVRKSHAELDGVEFELKKGAWSKTDQKFIQPGITDINCRCTYSPIIKVDEEPVKKPVEKPVEKEYRSPGVKKAIKIESQIRNREFEEFHIVSFEGEVVLSKKGDKRHVPASKSDIEKMKNNIVTHNHPTEKGSEGRRKGDGGSFSPGDIELLFESGARELRAVSEKFNHSLSLKTFGIKMPKNPAAKVLVEWQKNSDIELDKLRKELKNPAALLTEADREVWHTIMEKTSKKFKWLNYEREKVDEKKVEKIKPVKKPVKKPVEKPKITSKSSMGTIATQGDKNISKKLGKGFVANTEVDTFSFGEDTPILRQTIKKDNQSAAFINYFIEPGDSLYIDGIDVEPKFRKKLLGNG